MATDNGIIHLHCNGYVDKIADCIIQAFEAHGLCIFARIDQRQAAQDSGLDMRPMELILFGNPAAGTPLMVEYPSLAIDLPLKLLIWEDWNGKVWASYTSPKYLQQRHGMANPPFEPVAGLIQSTLQKNGARRLTR
jgi:uncharacterized protein (DUF302 family)